MSYDDLDDRFDADPQGVTDQVIAQAAAKAAIHVSEIRSKGGPLSLRNLFRVRSSQPVSQPWMRLSRSTDGRQC
jgi:hypothetical protein